MAKLTNSQLQEKLDVQKWLDSEVCGADSCGTYDYCEYCVKTDETPCAKAYNRAKRSSKKTEKTTKK